MGFQMCGIRMQVAGIGVGDESVEWSRVTDALRTFVFEQESELEPLCTPSIEEVYLPCHATRDLRLVACGHAIRDHASDVPRVFLG